MSDPEALDIHANCVKLLAPLIDYGYVSIHVAQGMDYWEAPGQNMQRSYVHPCLTKLNFRMATLGWEVL